MQILQEHIEPMKTQQVEHLFGLVSITSPTVPYGGGIGRVRGADLLFAVLGHVLDRRNKIDDEE